MRFARPKPLDVMLGACAVCFGSMSLTYPFGHDQGLYAYVAREWVQRGAIPYRDVFDHKTPGIYLIHAVAELLFGDTMWGIRVLDLLAVLVSGIIVARIATPRDQSPKPGTQGFACLLMSIIHYGFFDYWNTGQSELWYSLLGLTSILAVLRGTDEKRAQWIAGVFAGLTMVMKPPGIWFVLIAVILLVRRVLESRDRIAPRIVLGLARFGFGFAAPVALVLGYFAAHHALPAMFDIVVGANGYYVKHDASVHSVRDVLGHVVHVFNTTTPLIPILAIGLVIQIVLAARAHDRKKLERYLLAASCFVAALAALLMQLKFYWLHWVVAASPATLIGVTLVGDVAEWIARRTKQPESRWIVACAALAVLAYAVDYSPASYWFDQQKVGFLRLTGQIDRRSFDRYFVIKKFYYFYESMDDVAAWIDEHTKPDDTIVVRGFNPELYILAHRHYGGRFFWTNFLTEPERAYRRADYLAEEENAFATTHPRYVVALTPIHEGIDSPEWHEARGYHVREVIGPFTLLEPNDAR